MRINVPKSRKMRILRQCRGPFEICSLEFSVTHQRRSVFPPNVCRQVGFTSKVDNVGGK